jgi:hypothetical protein
MSAPAKNIHTESRRFVKISNKNLIIVIWKILRNELFRALQFYNNK